MDMDTWLSRKALVRGMAQSFIVMLLEGHTATARGKGPWEIEVTEISSFF